MSRTGASLTEHHAHKQQSGQTGSALGEAETGLSLDEPPGRDESGLPEPDWTLEETKLTIPEQEARFTLHENGRYTTKIVRECPACGMRHCLSLCPFVFPDNPKGIPKLEKYRLGFERKMRKYPAFHEAVCRRLKPKTLRVGREVRNLSFIFIVPTPTLSVPSSKQRWLSDFDDRVHYHGAPKAGRTPVRDVYNVPRYTFFSGYYATTDDDGRPFLILFTNTAHMDETMALEINMIRTFVTEYNRGEKTLYNREPEPDCRPIGVVLVTYRWHKPKSSGTASAPSITVGIASEYTWTHGYARWGIHLKAKADKLENGYWAWSSGRPKVSGAHAYIDWDADTARGFDSDSRGWVVGLGYALLRDVRDPVELIVGLEESALRWDRILNSRQWLLHRAATLYGTGSPQYRLLYHFARDSGPRDLPRADGLPQWKHFQSRIDMAGKPYEEEVIWRSVFH
ncbi:hypothetical protein KVR01_013014 [Diaporthe batatas]|uniref:uncharacterized protein n=1 Tax=Diaporthe batatas TaxID=748121 RepID=UPI001D051C61|nr:uncharacterized protein KVR01_013014 [Diaporthe batatas]KAG8157024.1 hypothetical protein KVR01_013014 [Diaporthe batatas]